MLSENSVQTELNSVKEFIANNALISENSLQTMLYVISNSLLG